jgi:hypothetical protein
MEPREQGGAAEQERPEARKHERAVGDTRVRDSRAAVTSVIVPA